MIILQLIKIFQLSLSTTSTATTSAIDKVIQVNTSSNVGHTVGTISLPHVDFNADKDGKQKNMLPLMYHQMMNPILLITIRQKYLVHLKLPVMLRQLKISIPR